MKNDSVNIHAKDWVQRPRGSATTGQGFLYGRQGSLYDLNRLTSEGDAAKSVEAALSRKTKILPNISLPTEKIVEKILSLSSFNTSGLTVKIYDLPAEDFHLIEPLDIIIKYERGEYIALFPDLELYGEGNTEFEAVRDLKYEIIDLAEDILEVNDGDLGEQVASWKRTLNKILRCT